MTDKVMDIGSLEELKKTVGDTEFDRIAGEQIRRHAVLREGERVGRHGEIVRPASGEGPQGGHHHQVVHFGVVEDESQHHTVSQDCSVPHAQPGALTAASRWTGPVTPLWVAGR